MARCRRDGKEIGTSDSPWAEFAVTQTIQRAYRIVWRVARSGVAAAGAAAPDRTSVPQAVRAPSMAMDAPLMKVASSLSRNAVSAATSSEVPARPVGCADR